jgi:hypothetical protein
MTAMCRHRTPEGWACLGGRAIRIVRRKRFDCIIGLVVLSSRLPTMQ